MIPMSVFVEIFTELGEKIGHIPENILIKAEQKNPWFTQDMQHHAMSAWSSILTRDNISAWLEAYPQSVDNPLQVGVICAGNLPLVGLHDMLCVLASGHYLSLKPSGDDEVLMGEVAAFINDALVRRGMEPRIKVVEKLNEIQALIATGSSNTAMHLDYYFKHVPRLIRGHRSSIAVLTKDSTVEDIRALGKDIFMYFGLGCRNVSAVFMPEGFDIARFYEPLEVYSEVKNHNKYANNHTFRKALHLMNLEKIYDNDFLIAREDASLHSPVAVVHLKYYTNLEDVWNELREKREEIQVISGHQIPEDLPSCEFGQTQYPSLSDYADGKDTMQWLLNLHSDIIDN